MNRKQEELGTHILENVRNELYYYFPYLDGAFACISGKGSEETRTIGTDGEFFLFSPEYLLELYVKKPEAVRRGYLHMLLHCLYLHLFLENQEDRRLWNLACDIAVEQIISREKIPVLETGGNAKKIREKVFHILGNGADSAEKICRKLKEQTFPFHLEELEETFHFDDHTLWDNCTGEKGKKTREKWNRLLSYTESFDYIFYNYGMEHYGNLPLIEPLEYKEVNRLEELVIAIDTSGSCDGETVRRFLGETYSILSEKENFFHKMKVYLIQCDCCIQDVKVIHSEEEWKEYSKDITIQGRGGTDFRPVFRYVKEQQEKKEIRRLKALIYFTDGDGIYPGSKPDYETAFVFLHKTEKMELVPPWAIRLVAEQEGVRHNI